MRSWARTERLPKGPVQYASETRAMTPSASRAWKRSTARAIAARISSTTAGGAGTPGRGSAGGVVGAAGAGGVAGRPGGTGRGGGGGTD